MDNINYQHSDLYSRWNELSFAEQMLNIGSEVSRAIKWRDKNKERSELAFFRALELIHFTANAMYSNGQGHRIKELGRAKEVLYDYFYDGNEYKSTPRSLIKYYDDFITQVN